MIDPRDDIFPRLTFKGRLRPSQKEAVRVLKKQLARGERRLHVVAPPGAGKTVLGLYTWAELVREPAVVLSPNSAIQTQWTARLDLFKFPDRAQHVSIDPSRAATFNSYTYQSVTLPRRADADLDAAAIDRWCERLIETGQAEDIEEAMVWIDDLRDHNPAYHEERLATYRKDVRDMRAQGGKALSTLHATALSTLHRLKERGVGLVILDECHHLMGHWGRVLADAHELLDGPVVLGLTATPPDNRGRDAKDVGRYEQFFGPVDFEVPVPALVKEGLLAPYQDLAYFVRPTAKELEFVAQADAQLHEVVDALCAPRRHGEAAPERIEPLPEWLIRVLTERRLPTGPVKDWNAFVRRDGRFADCARLALLRMGLGLPSKVPAPSRRLLEQETPILDVVVPVLDRYIRHGLRRSADAADHELADRAVTRLRMLGLQVTETGTRPCASPVSRVLAYAQGKTDAAVEILKAEAAVLGASIRAVVITDYEKTSALTAEISHVLDEEAGGAIAAFRRLLRDDTTDALNPALVTGSTVLIDDDLLPVFMRHARAWIEGRGAEAELTSAREAGFHIVHGRGRDWSPRLYVGMITELFQQGVTRCLVGTRGLLGEGWDAHTVNVLIDLTTVTTSMSVNQLRGRSIRLDPAVPEKVADNWDVVCVAGEFANGLDDYHRFIDKHRVLYGATDDGAIEKGVGHVHAAFTELKPEGVEGSIPLLNAEMLGRASRRDLSRQRWRIGERFSGRPMTALELKSREGGQGGLPPFVGGKDPWSDRSLALAIGRCVLGALRDSGQIEGGGDLHVGERAGGYVRLFLRDAEPAASELFARSVREALGAFDRPRYIISRSVDEFTETLLSRIMPEIVARFLRKRRRRLAMYHAVPQALAKNKSLVEIYERWWNTLVSPGEAVYALQGDGLDLAEQAKREGLLPATRSQEKQVFV